MNYLCYLNLGQVNYLRFIIDLSVILKAPGVYYFLFLFKNVSSFAAATRMYLYLELCPKELCSFY